MQNERARPGKGGDIGVTVPAQAAPVLGASTGNLAVNGAGTASIPGGSDSPGAVVRDAAGRGAGGPGVWLVVAAVIVAAVMPTAFCSGFHLFQLTMMVVYAIAILGLALLTGFNGQISLGHGAFFAIGAYTTAILMANWDVPYWATLLPAVVICGIVGFLLGFPALRLAGHYLALTTFSLSVVIPQLLKHNLVSDWTGGVQGLTLDKPDAPFGLPLSGDQWVYLFTFGIGVVAFVLAWNIVHGRMGRAMMAVRDHSLAAEAMGVDVSLLKTRTFAVSAMFTGLAGALSAIAVQYVAPDSFGIFLSIFLFVGLVVGGVASIGGTIVGALFVEFVPNLADSVSKAAPGAVYGALLIAVLFLMPEGAGGLAASLWRRLWR